MKDHEFAILGVSEFANTLTRSNMAWRHLPIDAVKKRIAPIGNGYLAGTQSSAPVVHTVIPTVVHACPRIGADIYQTTRLGYHGANRLTK